MSKISSFVAELRPNIRPSGEWQTGTVCEQVPVGIACHFAILLPGVPGKVVAGSTGIVFDLDPRAGGLTTIPNRLVQYLNEI